jgi:hypothetical protein
VLQPRRDPPFQPAAELLLPWLPKLSLSAGHAVALQVHPWRAAQQQAGLRHPQLLPPMLLHQQLLLLLAVLLLVPAVAAEAVGACALHPAALLLRAPASLPAAAGHFLAAAKWCEMQLLRACCSALE